MGAKENKQNQDAGRIKFLEQQVAEANMILKLLVAAGFVTDEKVEQARELASGLK